MEYHIYDELVIKFPINWHSKLKIFIFDQKMQNGNFYKSNQNKYGLLALGFSCTKQSAFCLENPFEKFLLWT